ncbi:hypothetical protein [Cecembia sp.]|uniref:hypothetical protein n=1 Tax=Cecembia sp. TaxID=1898110 RepID=UPI0025C26A7D|nr:hypothetical protein [Cecembia sp.]
MHFVLSQRSGTIDLFILFPNGVDYNPVDISKSSIPGKTLTDYKQDQFIINAVRLKIQLADGQKYAYSLVQAQIDSLINTIDKELTK